MQNVYEHFPPDNLVRGKVAAALHDVAYARSESPLFELDEVQLSIALEHLRDALQDRWGKLRLPPAHLDFVLGIPRRIHSKLLYENRITVELDLAPLLERSQPPLSESWGHETQ